MKARESFNWDRPEFAVIKGRARDVVEAYQNAARFLDTVKEWVYIHAGMVHTSDSIHKMAHEMPGLFDKFGDMLHERHLEVMYPATPELTEPIEDMDKAYEIIIDVLERISTALEAFHSAADNAELRPMQLLVEELMLKNSQSYTAIAEQWSMWDMRVSESSFDNWVAHQMEGRI